MITITLEKAGDDLGRLIEQVKAGEEIIITSDNQPVAKIVAMKKANKPRVPGRLQGQIDLPDSFFFEPLPDKELRLWSGDSDEQK